MGLSGVSFCHLLFSVLLPNPHVGAQAFKRGAIRHPLCRGRAHSVRGGGDWVLFCAVKNGLSDYKSCE